MPRGTIFPACVGFFSRWHFSCKAVRFSSKCHLDIEVPVDQYSTEYLPADFFVAAVNVFLRETLTQNVIRMFLFRTLRGCYILFFRIFIYRSFPPSQLCYRSESGKEQEPVESVSEIPWKFSLILIPGLPITVKPHGKTSFNLRYILSYRK